MEKYLECNYDLLFPEYQLMGVLPRQMNLRYHQMLPINQIYIFWKVLINHIYYISNERRGTMKPRSSEMALPWVIWRLAGIENVWAHTLLHDNKHLEPCRLQPESAAFTWIIYLISVIYWVSFLSLTKVFLIILNLMN